MKRMTALLLCIILAVSLCGCAGGKPAAAQAGETTLDINNENNTASTAVPEPSAGEMEGCYSVCTYYSKAEVEGFAREIKGYILEKDWKSLSAYISYPISIGGYSFDNEDSFARGEFADLLDGQFYDALEMESCEEMFCNWQGIMLGNGEVWIGECNGLKVIGINVTDHGIQAIF